MREAHEDFPRVKAGKQNPFSTKTSFVREKHGNPSVAHVFFFYSCDARCGMMTCVTSKHEVGNPDLVRIVQCVEFGIEH